MRKCEDCGKLSVEFAFDTGKDEIWECKNCGARYTLDQEFGEMVHWFENPQ